MKDNMKNVRGAYRSPKYAQNAKIRAKTLKRHAAGKSPVPGGKHAGGCLVAAIALGAGVVSVVGGAAWGAVEVARSFL